MATIFIPAPLQDLTQGQSRVTVSAGTVGEAIAALDRRFPGVKERLCDGEALRPSLRVSIDEAISAQGLRAKLAPDSEVHFLPAIGGG